MEHEVRYQGTLLAHFPNAHAADDYVARRLADPPEGTALEPMHFEVAPRRPIGLYCRGNLVDTFDTETQAATLRDALLERFADTVDESCIHIGTSAPTS